MAEYVLAIDGGTESVRVGLFDRSGRLMAKAAHSYGTAYPRSGWAEQDPDEWWAALASASRACLAAASISGKDVAGISAVATTCTLVPLGTDGRHVRPALLWMDVRAAQQAERVSQTGHAALSYCRAGCSAEWMLPKAMWLREHEPQVYARTSHFAEYLDWLMYRFTGRLVLNRDTATQRWFYNCRTWDWPADLFASVGLPDLTDKIPSEIVPIGARVGSITPEAAEALGLTAGTPVFEGGGDAFVALLGLNVTRPGKVGMITGSSTVVAAFAADEVHGAGVFGGFPDAVVPGLWLVEAGQASTGSMLAWFRSLMAQDLPADTAFVALDDEAAAVAPGSNGLIVLDSFQGNRTPYTDASARGAIWGLSLHTTRAHIFRAMMEGIAYGTRHILDVFAHLGCRSSELYVCGGATHSNLFLQILTDVCSLPLVVTEVAEASLLGGAIVAAAGLGMHSDITAASNAMVRPRKTYEPGAQQHTYLPYFELYKQTYPQLRSLMHTMSRHESSERDNSRR